MKSKNSISDFFNEVLKTTNTNVKILTALTKALVQDTPFVEIKLDSGKIYKIPSLQGIYKKIQKLSEQRKLVYLDEEKVFINEPKIVRGIPVPKTFNYEDNSLLKYLLRNLNLYTKVNLTNLVSKFSEKANIKRVIIPQDIKYNSILEKDFVGKNDINLESLLRSLNNLSIPYRIDETIFELDPNDLESTGSFILLSALSSFYRNDEFDYIRDYKIDKTTYSDYTQGTTITKILLPGDKLYNPETDDLYEIVAIKDNTISLGTSYITDALTLGKSELKIYSNIINNKFVEIPVDINEYQFLFTKEITRKNIQSPDWGNGISFNSNLLTVTEGGVTTNLFDFYKSKVYSYYEFLLNLEKNGLQFLDNNSNVDLNVTLKPNAPTISSDMFKVVQINDFTQEEINQNAETLKNLRNTYQNLISEIDSIRKQLVELSNKYSNILNNTPTTDPIILGIRTKNTNLNNRLNELLPLKDKLEVQFKDINISTSTLVIGKKTKFDVRGFWPIPVKKVYKGKEQEIIQFIIQYRYISKTNGNSTQTSHDIVENGKTVTASYSTWIQRAGILKSKVYDEKTKTYSWEIEDVENSNQININQLSLALNPGEAMEIRIKSISETNYPIAPLESDWSQTVKIDFPTELEDVIRRSQDSETLQNLQLQLQLEVQEKLKVAEDLYLALVKELADYKAKTTRVYTYNRRFDYSGLEYLFVVSTFENPAESIDITKHAYQVVALFYNEFGDLLATYQNGVNYTITRQTGNIFKITFATLDPILPAVSNGQLSLNVNFTL